MRDLFDSAKHAAKGFRSGPTGRHFDADGKLLPGNAPAPAPAQSAPAPAPSGTTGGKSIIVDGSEYPAPTEPKGNFKKSCSAGAEPLISGSDNVHTGTGSSGTGVRLDCDIALDL